MLEWFRTGKDIHLASACKKYHEDYNEIIKIYQDEQHPEYKLWKKRRKESKNFIAVNKKTKTKFRNRIINPNNCIKINIEEYVKTE